MGPLAGSNATRSDFKYPSDFGFLEKCRNPSDSESVTSLFWYQSKARMRLPISH